MNLVGKLAQWPPSGRVRRYLRDFIDTEFRGYPRAVLRFRDSELSISLDMVLSHYRVLHPQVRFLQVGAFDGVSGDPIYALIEKHGLQGILIEPQRDAFERLTANYAHFDPTAFVLVNAAIAPYDGTATLFRIKPGAQGPPWLHQIASFDRGILMRHAKVVPHLDSLIESEQVQCKTFAAIFAETGIQRIDMLLVDTEGYDAEVLRLFDIHSRRPAIILFEHKHLSLADYEQSIGSLVELGYKFTVCQDNTLAYLGSD